MSGTKNGQPTGTDWARLDAMTDEEIVAGIAADPDAAPEIDEDWLRQATLVFPKVRDDR